MKKKQLIDDAVVKSLKYLPINKYRANVKPKTTKEKKKL